MNKFGIKVYADRVKIIDGVNYNFNSIKYINFNFINHISKFRVINYNRFGIKLRIINNE